MKFPNEQKNGKKKEKFLWLRKKEEKVQRNFQERNTRWEVSEESSNKIWERNFSKSKKKTKTKNCAEEEKSYVILHLFILF